MPAIDLPRSDYDALNDLALREGLALFGVADVTGIRDSFLLPDAVRTRFTRAIAAGVRLSRAVLQTVEGAPNQHYYFHYQRANILLDQTAIKLTAWLQARGWEAMPIPASQVIDWDKQLGSVSHREIARRAGLGWMGRNNLLVNPLYGSQVRYLTVLTDAPLPADAPTAEGCGECRRCAAACPAGAIADAGFNRDACHQKLKEFTKTQRIGQMICGVCVKECRGAAKEW